ncbi:MAG: hypothetical protein Q4D37_07040, partial [Oscillospiraceae bacterium]|nr:hypothetical protein [Oscillospiraceae bacterium]
SLPAEAGSLSARPDSAFTYDLAVEGTTNGQIKVTFYTTYNPGVSILGVALKYDSNRLSFSKRVVDLDYASVLSGNAKSNNVEMGLVTSVTSTQVVPNSGQLDYENPIYISYFFDVKDKSKSNYEFSANVYAYKSQFENINFDNTNLTGNYPDETIMETVNKGMYIRKIGDIIPDSIIRLEDAIEVLNLLAICEDTDTYPAPSMLNTYLTCSSSSQLSNGSTLVWNQRFKDTLYANNVAFAEVADCDQNGLIEQEDADMLMEYYAQQSAAQSPESLINTEISKVVYAEITM